MSAGILSGVIGSFIPDKNPVQYIGFVSTSNPQTTSTNPNPKTLNLNPAWSSTDFLIYVAASEADSLSVPAGWTSGALSNLDNPNYVWAYKVKGSTSSVSVIQDSAATVMCFRNVSTTSPLDVSAIETNGATGNPDSGEITTVTNNSMVVSVGYVHNHAVATTPTPPTGFTLIDFEANNGTWDNYYSTVMSGYLVKQIAGAEDPSAWTSTANNQWWATTIALRPQA